MLDEDPLTLLTGELDHQPELPILLDLLAEAEERAGRAGAAALGAGAGPARAGRWTRCWRATSARFEDALATLAERGFVLRSGGG